MCRSNKQLILSLVFFLLGLANYLNAVDYGGPYRPYSENLQINKHDLRGMDEAAYATMSLDDLRLHNAYASVMQCFRWGEFQAADPEYVGALADMRKRGNLVTPLMLKLLDENQETGFECSALANIDAVGTLDLAPYLAYARNVLRERTHTMSAVLAGCAASLLATHGTKEDVDLLRWVMETRPFVEDSVTRKLDSLNRRLGLPKQESRLPLKERRSTSESPNGTSAGMENKTPAVTAANELKAPPWVAWALTILIAGGLIWQVFNQRKFRGQ